MIKKIPFRLSSLVIVSVFALASCTSINKGMREPNSRVDFTSKDFTFSEQQSAEAVEIKIIGVDWKRLFNRELGSVDKLPFGVSVTSIPVIGGYLASKPSSYALYNLMSASPGYDVIFYPQFETTVKRPIIIPIYKVTTVKVKARLAKIKTN